MKRINEDIKTGQFKKLYLLYGPEDYLRLQYKDKLKKAFCPDGDTMNFSYFEGKDINVSEVIGISDTMPFFAEKRLVMVENSGFFKKACEEMNEYLPTLPDSTVLVFVESEVDKKTKMFKRFNDEGRAIAFETPTPEMMSAWVRNKLKAENLSISGSDYNLLLEYTGLDMNNISNELEKLCCYCMGRGAITAADIDEVCIRRIETKVFDMVDAMAFRQRKKAMEMFYDMLLQKEQPVKILVLIGKHYVTLAQVKQYAQTGLNTREITFKLGFAPNREFAVRKYLDQAKRYSLEEIKQIIADVNSADADIKMGKMGDKLSVEMLISKYTK